MRRFLVLFLVFGLLALVVFTSIISVIKVRQEESAKFIPVYPDGMTIVDIQAETKKIVSAPPGYTSEAYEGFDITPDEKYAVIVIIDGKQNRFLYLINATGEHKIIGEGWGPVWSPDETKLAFTSLGPGKDQKDKGSQVFLTSRYGGAYREELTYPPLVDCTPGGWADDHHLVVMCSEINTAAGGLYLVNIESKKYTSLYREKDRSSHSPSVSKDGDIIFISQRTDTTDLIKKISLKDTSRSATSIVHMTGNFSNPLWSPDGKHFLLRVATMYDLSSHSADSFVYEMFVFEADGSGEKFLDVAEFVHWDGSDNILYSQDGMTCTITIDGSNQHCF